MTQRSDETLATVRRAVRSVIESTPELRNHPELERRLASRMVGISLAAADLIAEEKRLSDDIASRAEPSPEPMAVAQAAGDIHRRTAVDSAADVLTATRDAIDFPNFVTSLITGVFQAIQNTSIQQLEAFGDLLDAVDTTTDDFATTQITDARATQWAMERFGVFTIEEYDDEKTLTLKEDAQMPDSATLERALGATASEARTVVDGDLETTLLPLVKRKLARERQSMLATMVLMGLQRVVVDDGHIHASMRLQVDARSAAEQAKAEQFDTRVETEASGSFGVGAWGASARMAASVGYVKSDEQFTSEDIAVSAGLRSSVDLRFRTLPLDVTRMAGGRKLDSLVGKSMVPDRERELGAPGSLLAKKPPRSTNTTKLPTPVGAGKLLDDDKTLKEASKAREAAAKRDEEEQKKKDAKTPPKEPPKKTPPPDQSTKAPAKTKALERVGGWATPPTATDERYTR